MAPETAQTLDRGLRVLEVIADSPEGLTVTELSAQLDVGRTVIYRLVVTLESHALIRRGSDGRCRLGLGLLTLGRAVQPAVRDAAVPSLRLLADAVGATAHLTIAEGSDGLTAVMVEPSREPHAAIRMGTRQPLEATAGGRAILAARLGRGGDLGWLVGPGDSGVGGHGLAIALAGVPGLEAAVGVVSAREFSDAEVGPRVARAAGEIARVLR